MIRSPFVHSGCLSISLVLLATWWAVDAAAQAPIPQTPEPLGGFFEVSGLIDPEYVGFAAAPETLTDEAGRYLVVWHEFDKTVAPPFRSIRSRAYSPAGEPISEIAILAPRDGAETPAQAREPQIARMPNGDFAMAWQETDDAGQRLLYGRFAWRGMAVGEPVIVRENAGVLYRENRLDVSSTGRTAVLWAEGGEFGLDDLYVQRFDVDANPVGEPILVETGDAPWAAPADVKMMPGNFFWVSWNTENGAFLQRFAADGVPVGGQVALPDARDARVTPSQGGAFLLVWRVEQDLYSRRYTQAGRPIGVAVRVNSETPDALNSGRATRASNGDFVVSWGRADQPYPNYDVYTGEVRLQRLDEEGRLLGEEITVDGVRQEGTPRVAVGAQGDFMVVWHRRHSEPGGSVSEGIRAQHFALGSCRESETSFCLNGRRFRAQVEWTDPQGEVGFARPVGKTEGDSSELLYFFSEDNWEMVVKVLDGCSINGHYWIFAATASGVEFTLTVEDTVSGASKSYRNPPGRRAESINDSTAFATCS